MGRKRRPTIGITSQAEADEEVARQLAWNARWRGLSTRGVEERVKQLNAMEPAPPELSPQPAPVRKANRRRGRSH